MYKIIHRQSKTQGKLGHVTTPFRLPRREGKLGEGKEGTTCWGIKGTVVMMMRRRWMRKLRTKQRVVKSESKRRRLERIKGEGNEKVCVSRRRKELRRRSEKMRKNWGKEKEDLQKKNRSRKKRDNENEKQGENTRKRQARARDDKKRRRRKRSKKRGGKN